MKTPKEAEANHAPPPTGEPPAHSLDTAEERLEVILGFTSSIMFEFDPEGRYQAVLSPVQELLVTPKEQLLGRTLTEVFGPEAAAPFYTTIEQILTTGQTAHFEFGLDVMGGRRWFRADGMLMPRRQNVLFLVQDISHRKGLEQHLIQADRLAALGTLSAGVAHEVNNPLSYVSANLNFVVEGLTEFLGTIEKPDGAPDPDSLKRTVKDFLDALAEAREGTARIRRVVGDLKNFARDDDPGQGDADVARALETAITVANPELKYRARLFKQLSEVPLVRGSEARLGQVFLNLLINAAQAIPEGAPDKNRVEVRLRREEEKVVIEIQDTGTGIPPEIRDRIFEPFFSTKPRGVGTGLGLSICNDIINRLGGDISVESTLGQGSCFRVRLPVG